MDSKTKTTIDENDVARFAALGEAWWDENGPMAPLHRMAPTRLQYIRDQLDPIAGKTILDVGCGGGLVCEPLARMGATVTGIDAAPENIQVAQNHARINKLDITYQTMTAEDIVKTKVMFDAVLALEIVEHVADVDLFVRSCMALLKPGGTLILSTLNRTAKSYLFGIIAAEYVLRWLDPGTHDWNKFLKPSELAKHITVHGAEVRDLTGLTYSPLTRVFSLSKKDLSVNYFLTARKN